MDLFSRRNKRPNSLLNLYQGKYPNIPKERILKLEESIHSDYKRKLDTLTFCLNDLANENEKLKRENQAILKILKSKEDMLVDVDMKVMEYEVKSSEYLKKLEEESFRLEMCIKENEKLTQDILAQQSLNTNATSQDKENKDEVLNQKSDADEVSSREVKKSANHQQESEDLNQTMSDDTSESYESHSDHELNTEFEEILSNYKDQQKNPLINLVKKLKISVNRQRKELIEKSDELEILMSAIEKNEKKFSKVIDYYKKTLRNEKTEREEAEKRSQALKKKVISLEYILEGVDTDSDENNSSSSDYENDEDES